MNPAPYHMPDLKQFRITNQSIAAFIRSNDENSALETARQNLAQAQSRLESADQDHQRQAITDAVVALSDLGSVIGMYKDADQAIGALQQAMRLAPTHVVPFHNIAALLLKAGQLRGDNLTQLINHLQSVGKTTDWARNYLPLCWMPTFLNLEFVEGKCNLKCRMCIGTNAASHPNKFRSMSVDDFRHTLEAAPTISGITLSSSDSDPLLHAQFLEIIDVAKEYNVVLDLFTNGLPMSERTARHIVESQAVNMVNFSIDAATDETYTRIRGGNFARLNKNMRMLVDLKNELNSSMPMISLSFVAMEDNIEELPAFVEMAKSYGAKRVFVEDLLGWLDGTGGNHPAIDNPRCQEFVSLAQRTAQDAGIMLHLPERLREGTLEPAQTSALDSPATSPSNGINEDLNGAPTELVQTTESATEIPYADNEYRCCTWLQGVWVSGNGDLQPCCMLQDVADMGNAKDGKLFYNEKYNDVKAVLSQGKVFRECASKSMCGFVQQEHARGRPLKFIADEELARLRPAARASKARDDTHQNTIISLPVLQAI